MHFDQSGVTAGRKNAEALRAGNSTVANVGFSGYEGFEGAAGEKTNGKKSVHAAR